MFILFSKLPITRYQIPVLLSGNTLLQHTCTNNYYCIHVLTSTFFLLKSSSMFKLPSFFTYMYFRHTCEGLYTPFKCLCYQIKMHELENINGQSPNCQP